MIGMAFIMKCVYGNLSKNAVYVTQFNIEGIFKNCTLVTKQSTSILKVCLEPVYRVLKIRVGCGSDCVYRDTISA